MTYDVEINGNGSWVSNDTIKNTFNNLFSFENWSVHNGVEILEERHVKKWYHQWSGGKLVSPFSIQFENEEDAVLFRLMLE